MLASLRVCLYKDKGPVRACSIHKRKMRCITKRYQTEVERKQRRTKRTRRMMGKKQESLVAHPIDSFSRLRSVLV